jgi:adenosylcobinamide kinase / adenosylcobinamide-phosphate guanylyltransferase
MSTTFLIGGARSGKSRRAVSLATDSGAPVAMIVTAEAKDDEMHDRIALHQAERPKGWTIIEAARSVETAALTIEPDRTLIIDCVSFWVANLVMDGETDIEARAERLAAALHARHSLNVVVTNEVGMGLVPEYELGRRFRDVLGRVNAILAAAADEAYLVVAGRQLQLH